MDNLDRELPTAFAVCTPELEGLTAKTVGNFEDWYQDYRGLNKYQYHLKRFISGI